MADPITRTITSEAALSLISKRTITATADLYGLTSGEQAAYVLCEALIDGYGWAWPGESLEEQDTLWDMLVDATGEGIVTPDTDKQDFSRYALDLTTTTPTMLSTLHDLDSSLLPESYPGLFGQRANQCIFLSQESWPSYLTEINNAIAFPDSAQWNRLALIYQTVLPVLPED